MEKKREKRGKSKTRQKSEKDGKKMGRIANKKSNVSEMGPPSDPSLSSNKGKTPYECNARRPPPLIAMPMPMQYAK
jgi:hypothetical protein